MIPVKICGLTRQKDVTFAESLGVWALGMIFYPKSPRAITPEQGAELRVSVKGILKVGVFVDSSLDEIIRVTEIASLSAIQLHGDETPQFCRELKWGLGNRKMGDRKIFKTFRPKSVQDTVLMSSFKDCCDAFLIDTFVSGQLGGTGKPARWDLAVLAKKNSIKIILSGGLNSENVSAALTEVNPDALDVSSGLESSPGLKDPIKMAAFVESVRLYENLS